MPELTSIVPSPLASDEVSSPSFDGEAPVRVLIVDDEDALRSTLARVFRQRGIVTVLAENGFVALDILARTDFDVVLVDVRMPGMTGPQFLERVKTQGYSIEVVMMTAFTDIATTVSAVKAGAYGFLTKPFVSNDAVVIEVQNAAQFRRLRERTEVLQRELATRPPAGEMVGTCAAMREVHRLIDGVATTNSTILVLGESGTGKELVARAIHERSRRAHRALVAVNCAAIPKDLVESELFGHTRGAFTSAVAARAGLFEAANGGTIFLDEIGDLPVGAQVKLLRTLQSGEIKPVGSDAVKTVDVRVIAATNADLKVAITNGTFRRDLYYRLNVIAIRLPALRDRGDDVLLLAHHFIRKHAAATGRPASRLSNEAAMCLRQHEWLGNVRELEHAIEHSVVLCDSDTITPRFLPLEVQHAADTSSGVASTRSSSASPQSSRSVATARAESFARFEQESPSPRREGAAHLLDSRTLHGLPYAEAKRRFLAEFNRAYVSEVMSGTRGNMSEAARRSGLDRSNFRRLLRSASGVEPSRPSDASHAPAPLTPEEDEL